MRNILLIGLFTCLLFTSCGPNAEMKRAEMIADSATVSDSITGNATLAENIDLSTKTPDEKKFIKTCALKFKVNNVLSSTERIEDLASRYGGYLIYSNLQNRNENSNSTRISRDSILISNQIVVINEIQMRIPNERLDSMIRKLNSLVVFLDYRVIKLNDVTLQFISNQKKADRLQKFAQRQQQHIDYKTGKLKETTTAEDNLLERQNQTDELQTRTLELEDQMKFCNLTIEIYQKPIITKEIVANFDYVANVKPNFFYRVWDSLIQGWGILQEVVIFLIKIWGIALLIIVLVFGVKYLLKLYKKIK
jgi:hypothetical protein